MKYPGVAWTMLLVLLPLLAEWLGQYFGAAQWALALAALLLIVAKTIEVAGASKTQAAPLPEVAQEMYHPDAVELAPASPWARWLVG